MVVAEEILDEYKRVLARLKVRKPLIGTIVNLLREEAELVPVRGAMGISPDPADDPFCDCADAGNADFIGAAPRTRDRARSADFSERAAETAPPTAHELALESGL